MKKYKIMLLGIPIGILNVLLGTGGGIVAVPILKKCGCDQKTAQANAVAVMLPLTVISIIIYAKKNYVNFFVSAWILPVAAVGAWMGTLLMRRIETSVMQKIFAVLLLWAGGRMLWSL